MAVTPPTEAPELVDIGTCWACGDRIGWVELPHGRRRPVDPEPRPLGPYALLRDGRRAVDLRPDYPTAEQEELDERYDGPRFWPHTKTCTASGVRLAGWSANHYDNTPEPIREARRQAILEADRLRDLGVDPNAF